MYNTLYVGLSREMVLRQQLDVVANNIANVDTAGFKLESLTVQDDPVSPSGAPGVGQQTGPINFAYDVNVVRDFTQGALKATGGTLDLGLQGDGFFQVQTANDVEYTRDGRFALNAQGQIVTAAGDPVLSTGGSPITLDGTKGAPQIARDGTVSQQNVIVGKIGVVGFASLAALQKAGGGYYTNASNLTAQPVQSTQIEQGMVEASNVDPISQMTRLIEVSRAYEQVAQMLDQTGNEADQAVQRLGKVN